MEDKMKRVEPQSLPNHWVFTKAPNLRWVFAQPNFQPPPSYVDPRCYVRDTVPVYPEPKKKKKKPQHIFDQNFRKQINHTAIWFTMMVWEVPRVINLMCDVDGKINEVMEDNCILLKDVFGEPPSDESNATATATATATGAESSSSVTTTDKEEEADNHPKDISLLLLK